jgi:hypothetical protein
VINENKHVTTVAAATTMIATVTTTTTTTTAATAIGNSAPLPPKAVGLLKEPLAIPTKTEGTVINASYNPSTIDKDKDKALTVAESRDLLRRLWSHLVLRPVYRVVPGKALDGRFVRRTINTSTGHGSEDNIYPHEAVKMVIPEEERGNPVEPEVKITKENTNVAILDWQAYEHYYGFTDKHYSYTCPHQINRPELRGQSIYFSSNGKANAFELWRGGTAWFSDESAYNALSTDLKVPPHVGQFIVGLVNQNERGWYFSRWAVASPWFFNLFSVVMETDSYCQKFCQITRQGIPHFETMADIFTTNGDDWMYGFTQEYCTEKGTSVNERKLPMTERLDAMKIPSFLYKTSPFSNKRFLYYVFQVFANGFISDYRGDPEDREEIENEAHRLFVTIRNISLPKKNDLLYDLSLPIEVQKERRKFSRRNTYYGDGWDWDL